MGSFDGRIVEEFLILRKQLKDLGLELKVEDGDFHIFKDGKQVTLLHSCEELAGFLEGVKTIPESKADKWLAHEVQRMFQDLEAYCRDPGYEYLELDETRDRLENVLRYHDIGKQLGE